MKACDANCVPGTVQNVVIAYFSTAFTDFLTFSLTSRAYCLLFFLFLSFILQNVLFLYALSRKRGQFLADRTATLYHRLLA